MRSNFRVHSCGEIISEPRLLMGGCSSIRSAGTLQNNQQADMFCARLGQ
ncbi:unnamed protein product, partial [Musa banksii]